MKNNSLSKMMSIVVLLFATVSSPVIYAGPFDGDDASARVGQMQERLAIMEQYLTVVQSVHAIADDPEKAVLFQLQQLEDTYRKQRNVQKIISLYQDVLKNTPNLTIRNAASMKLAQILKRVGRNDEAEELTRNSLNENLKRLK
ncbi:hypothetical protein [Kaarinaea lacus]